MIVVTRELTKLHEEVVRGRLGDIDIGAPRGEYVVVLAGRPTGDEPATDEAVRAALRIELGEGASTRDAAASVATSLGRAKREVYELALALHAPSRADMHADAAGDVDHRVDGPR